MKRIVLVLAALGAALSSPVAARALVDCPLRDTPFSVYTNFTN